MCGLVCEGLMLEAHLLRSVFAVYKHTHIKQVKIVNQDIEFKNHKNTDAIYACVD